MREEQVSLTEREQALVKQAEPLALEGAVSETRFTLESGVRVVIRPGAEAGLVRLLAELYRMRERLRAEGKWPPAGRGGGDVTGTGQEGRHRVGSLVASTPVRRA